MAQRWRLSAPPLTPDPDLYNWLIQVQDALNLLPNLSISSTTNGPESNTTGEKGDVLLDVGSAITGSWVKQTGSDTTGWVELDNYPIDSVATLLESSIATLLETSIATYTGGVDEAHAVLYVDSPGLGQQNLLVGTQSRLTCFDKSTSYGIDTTISDGTIGVTSAGTYLFEFSSSMTAKHNTVYDVNLFQNGSETSFGSYIFVDHAGDYENYSISGAILNASSNDTFCIMASQSDLTDTQGFTTVAAQFYARRLL